MLTVAFHESGHALTGLCTGAHIESIELDPELGGLTTMRGGIQYITLPAGCALRGSACMPGPAAYQSRCGGRRVCHEPH